MYKQDLALNNLQELICYNPEQPTNLKVLFDSEDNDFVFWCFEFKKQKGLSVVRDYCKYYWLKIVNTCIIISILTTGKC